MAAVGRTPPERDSGIGGAEFEIARVGPGGQQEARGVARTGASGARADRDHRERDAGSAAAEFAMTMPALVIALLILLTAAGAGMAQVRAVDAARAGVREAARGETADRVREEARRRAGDDARVGLRRGVDSVTVTVEIPLRGPLGRVIRTPLRGEATARSEAGP